MKSQLGLMVCKIVIIAIATNMGSHDAFQKNCASDYYVMPLSH